MEYFDFTTPFLKKRKKETIIDKHSHMFIIYKRISLKLISFSTAFLKFSFPIISHMNISHKET